ncbi:uncharacterized protein [Ptychodera flava]|uniref:uncharacterized protein n=1 Tax=Ptychodera flava TaxID=63121 RepID=UPI003969DC60
MSNHGGSFKWVDGEPIENRITDWSTNMQISPYCPDQPDEDGTACVRLSGYVHRWFDEPCYEQHRYVCEYSGSGTTIIPTTSVQTTSEISTSTPIITTARQTTDETTSALPSTPIITILLRTTNQITSESITTATATETQSSSTGPLTVDTTTQSSPTVGSEGAAQHSITRSTDVQMTTSRPLDTLETTTSETSPQNQSNAELTETPGILSRNESNNSLTTVESDSNSTTGFNDSNETSSEYWLNSTSLSYVTTDHTSDRTTESAGNHNFAEFLGMKEDALIIFSLWLGVSVVMVGACVVIDCFYLGAKLCHSGKYTT